MKVLLISVGRLPWYRKGAPLFFFYTPRMGLPSLAAVTPPAWGVAILDGVEVEDIDFEEPVDLVGFSVLTPFARETYKAAERYRARGVTVVMGGVHATLVPEEAARHADAVVVGEGEGLWPTLLSDFVGGALKAFYAADTPVEFETLPAPKYELIRNKDYAVANGIQLVRGCPYGRACKFCTVPGLFGTSYRTLSVPRAVDELRRCKESGDAAGVNLSACCALNHTDYMRAFAKAIRPMDVNWSGAGLLQRLNDDELLRLLAASGCELIYTESGVPSARKEPRSHKVCCEAASRIRDHGIEISYNFTVGFDDDTAEVFDEVEAFIEKSGLRRNRCAVQIFSPWPNSDAYTELDRGGRILDRDWSRYDNTHVVFQPKRMSVAELGARGR